MSSTTTTTSVEEVPTQPTLLDHILGPSLYRIFDDNHSRNYLPYTVERYADITIRLVDTIKTIISYGTPALIIYIGRQLYQNFNTASVDIGGGVRLWQYNSVKIFTIMSVAYFAAYIIRGTFRARNPSYRQFICTFKTATLFDAAKVISKDHQQRQAAVFNAREKLRRTYDYDFRRWPVDFHWSEGKYANERIPSLLPVEQAGGIPDSSDSGAGVNKVTRAISWTMSRTLARLMLYPGSVKVIQAALSGALMTGRQFLIENYQAIRYKLETRDRYHIDCILVDRRRGQKSSSSNSSNAVDQSSVATATDKKSIQGNTLVICAEGNLGFYEIGIFSSPLNLNYSVLGWNHPGFGDSTGVPYPACEINAFDAVINFAVTQLGFELENILLFGWSIGGFPIAWAASAYPEVKGVILDASFDDVLPLARARMMPLLLPIVDNTIRYHFNLNISAYLNRYPGPVLLIRRLQDEIIPVDPADPIRTNRGNFILSKLLRARFPELMDDDEVAQQVQQFLNTSARLRINNPEQCLVQLVSYITANNVQSYPLAISVEDLGGVTAAKDVILFMCYKLMQNFNSTHCTPLPSSMFQEPFDLFSHAK